MKKGLKPFGLACISRMDELGIIVDVSHLSEGGFWDVVQHGKRPFVASHSCARALCNHPRNLTDQQLRALANKGGVVGINFLPAFLTGTRYASVDAIVQHAVHISNVAGVDSVALGSDFDGFSLEVEMKDSSGYDIVVDALRKQFTSSEVDKICSGNALRVFHDTLMPSMDIN